MVELLCKNCGTRVEPDDRYCVLCGSRIDPDADLDPIMANSDRVHVPQVATEPIVARVNPVRAFVGLALIVGAFFTIKSAFGDDARAPAPTRQQPTQQQPSEPVYVPQPVVPVAPQPYVVYVYCNISGFTVQVYSDGSEYHTGLLC